MAADPAGIYIVIAPVAAAFAGFGSLASGLGQEHRGDDAKVDAFRLANMLFASLSATLLGFLPATLESLSLADRSAVRVAAVVALLGIAAYLPRGFIRARRIRGASGFSIIGGLGNLACLLTASAAFALCAFDVRPGLEGGLYLLGLMGLLGSSVVMFWRVISSMLRPSHGP